MGTNLSTAGTETDQDLEPEFTYDDLLSELSQYMPDIRRPGDVDAKQIAARYGIKEPRALVKMREIAGTGKYISLTVYDPDRGYRVKVLRKVVQS